MPEGISIFTTMERGAIV